ncbi:CBS domain-containing protein, partial [Pseudoalteromonas ruthenica]
VDNRHGCMPVVSEQGQLVGILTSSDFVRLAAALLS